jgi:hypothetical protein
LCFFCAAFNVVQASLSFSSNLSKSQRGLSFSSFSPAHLKHLPSALWLMLLFFMSE